MSSFPRVILNGKSNFTEDEFMEKLINSWSADAARGTKMACTKLLTLTNKQPALRTREKAWVYQITDLCLPCVM